jgi:hypothetical protein
MRPLLPEETEITGKWIMVQDSLQEDETCRRINVLIKGYLIEVGRDESGWDVLYRDPHDDRLWELIYPHSELQGGGPPQLRNVSLEEADHKFVI